MSNIDGAYLEGYGSKKILTTIILMIYFGFILEPRSSNPYKKFLIALRCLKAG
jgi:hypothetical protein